MRVLAASDVHGNHAVYRWLVRKAHEKRVEALILAGDLLGFPDGYETIESAQSNDSAVIVSIIKDADIPIYYIMGNDDFVELNPRLNQFTSIHGRRVELEGVNVVGYQYSLPFMGGIYEKPEEQIRLDLQSAAEFIDSNTVLVTHSPAYGVLDIGILDLHAGSQAIMELVRGRNVRAHIHGHVHQCFGRQGRHFNVASAGRRRSMLIDLENLSTIVEEEPDAA